MSKLKWGILSTGTIAKNFAQTARDMGDISLHAVASRNVEAADAFGDAYGIAVRHASYEALAHDKDVDIVYVATPHSRHYEDMKLLIGAGKHVMCEKSFTTDARQAAEIFALAQEKGVFVMEAFWTKFIPLYRQIERIIAEGIIGEIRMVTALYGYTTGRQARKFDATLAGGTLLDIGVYTIGFACMMLGYQMDAIGSMLLLNGEGTDATDAITLRKGNAVAQLTCAIGANTPVHGAVYGTKGHIDIPDFKNPQCATLYVDGQAPVSLEHPFEVNGFEYEIREAERCVQEGRLQSDVMTGEQTVAVMRIMDEIRRQNGMHFPFER
ncbi:MAG TPA: Gfo/Idh/MocA family oxidoreductase [Candidatus Ventricola gallistercoris]|nr:Gfo/Idh/MocA family oxidoreductase [Candidatus Ventricola gallistercoris]